MRAPARTHRALAIAAHVLFWMSLYVYVPVLPTYARDLGASLGMVGLIVGAYGLTQLLLRIPIGVWSDRVALRKPFLIGGMLANAAGAAALAVSPMAWLLVVGRAVTGLGASTFVIASVHLAEFFPSRMVARATGIAVGLSAASQVVIMLIGGAVAEASTVGATFWVAVGLGLAGVVVLLPLPDHARAPQEQPPQVQALARAGTRRSTLVAATLAALLQYAQFGLTFAFVPLWADSLGASNFDLGLLGTVAVTANGLGALVLVVAGARLNGRLAAVFGFLLTAISSLLIPVLPNLAVLTLVQGIGGFGRGLVFPALMAHSIERAAPAERATAMGVFQGVYALGMFLGPVSAGVLGEWLGLDRVFLLIGALMVLGALAAARYVAHGDDRL
ncbi:MAG: MFS transporter [Chloroflexi bacterium]|nr:MFS transporter [Chloroflexota bacterium]